MKKILLTTALLALGALLFNSCNKNEAIQEIIGSPNQFHSVLRASMDNVGAVPVGGGSSRAPGQPGVPSGEIQTIYLDIQDITPEIRAKIENVNSIRSISELIIRYGAILEFSNIGGNMEVQFDIPVKHAKSSLSPIVAEAKKYLQSKGFSAKEIQEMIVEGGATEYDLIPLVIFLQEAEFSPSENPFFNCAAVMVGADYSGSLSKKAIKQTFSTSVSKKSGAVSVVIAVENFLQCMIKEMDVIVEAMITSDEFEKTLKEQKSFVEMFSFDKLEGTPQFVDFENIKTKNELMTWIGHNMAYTQFTSVAQAGSLFDALESQMAIISQTFISPRVQRDVALFEERALLWAEKMELEIDLSIYTAGQAGPNRIIRREREYGGRIWVINQGQCGGNWVRTHTFFLGIRIRTTEWERNVVNCNCGGC